MVSVASWVGMPTLATYSASKSPPGASPTPPGSSSSTKASRSSACTSASSTPTSRPGSTPTRSRRPQSPTQCSTHWRQAPREAVVDELQPQHQGRATRRPATRLPGHRGAVPGRAVRGAAVARCPRHGRRHGRVPVARVLGSTPRPSTACSTGERMGAVTHAAGSHHQQTRRARPRRAPCAGETSAASWPHDDRTAPS